MLECMELSEAQQAYLNPGTIVFKQEALPEGFLSSKDAPLLDGRCDLGVLIGEAGKASMWESGSV